MSFISHTTAVVATVVIMAFLRRALWPTRPRVIPNPLQTVIPRLSGKEIERLEYKPDDFPGGRDVVTPVRCYL